jgi:anti-sigma factor RsiW
MPDRHAAHLCRDPFDDALDAVVSGDASPRDWTILNDTLRSDPAARRTYIRSIAFEAMLAREFPPIEESSPTPANRRHRWFVPAAIAATITLAGILRRRAQPPTS